MTNGSGAREFPVETDFQKKVRRAGGITRNQADADQVEDVNPVFESVGG